MHELHRVATLASIGRESRTTRRSTCATSPKLLFAPMDQATFAKKFAARLRRAGVKDEIAYDAETFSLAWEGGRVNLGNFHAEYENAGFFGRWGLLGRFVAAVTSAES